MQIKPNINVVTLFFWFDYFVFTMLQCIIVVSWCFIIEANKVTTFIKDFFRMQLHPSLVKIGQNAALSVIKLYKQALTDRNLFLCCNERLDSFGISNKSSITCLYVKNLDGFSRHIPELLIINLHPK